MILKTKKLYHYILTKLLMKHPLGFYQTCYLLRLNEYLKSHQEKFQNWIRRPWIMPSVLYFSNTKDPALGSVVLFEIEEPIDQSNDWVKKLLSDYAIGSHKQWLLLTFPGPGLNKNCSFKLWGQDRYYIASKVRLWNNPKCRVFAIMRTFQKPEVSRSKDTCWSEDGRAVVVSKQLRKVTHPNSWRPVNVIRRIRKDFWFVFFYTRSMTVKRILASFNS